MLDYFRLLQVRARSQSVRTALQGTTRMPLTQRHNGILLVVAERSTMTVTQLADVLGLSVASASRHVAAMESWGLLYKYPAPHDARALVLSLTEEGAAARRAWVTTWVGYYSDALAAMPDEAQRALHVGMRSLCDGLSREPEYALVPPPESKAGALESVTSVARWLSLTVLHPDYANRLIGHAGLSLDPQDLLLLRAIGSCVELDVSALAAIVALDGSAVSRRAAMLEKQGLVSRSASPSDARSTLLRATPTGRWALITVEAEELGPLGRVMGAWGSEEANRFLEAMALLVARLSDLPSRQES